MAKYWIEDARLDEFHAVIPDGGYGLPDGWDFKLVDGNWWMVDTDGSEPELEAQVAEIAVRGRWWQKGA